MPAKARGLLRRPMSPSERKTTPNSSGTWLAAQRTELEVTLPSFLLLGVGRGKEARSHRDRVTLIVRPARERGKVGKTSSLTSKH